jgi:hypothetical protein
VAGGSRLHVQADLDPAGLAIAGALPTFAAATDTVGQDVYVKAANAGGTATAARVGALLGFLAGDGSGGTGTIAGGWPCRCC